MNEHDKLREKLAALEHEQWAHWEKYRASQEKPLDLAVTDATGQPMVARALPKDLHERWWRQRRTSYANLTEAEKNSDRSWADKAIEIMDDGMDVYRLRVSTQAVQIAELEAAAECAHEWWAERVVEGGGTSTPEYNYAVVHCSECGADGKVNDLDKHELTLTSHAVYNGTCRWYDPSRVVLDYDDKETI